MEIIAKISKGSNMDQIYIPKNRTGFPIGNYVIVTPVMSSLNSKKIEKLYFYGLKSLEPIKLTVIKEIFNIIDKKMENYGNIIVTGSFLEKGFGFNDIDILIISEEKANIEIVKEYIVNQIGIKPHIILIDNKSLIEGLSTDPLYLSMLSRCISKKRLIYNVKTKINYKLLDLQLLKSKIVIDNFDILSGNEKYYYLQNIIAIKLFLESKKVSKDSINKIIENLFKMSKDKIKQNLIDKKEFIEKYKQIYNKTFKHIMEHIGHESK